MLSFREITLATSTVGTVAAAAAATAGLVGLSELPLGPHEASQTEAMETATRASTVWRPDPLDRLMTPPGFDHRGVQGLSRHRRFGDRQDREKATQCSFVAERWRKRRGESPGWRPWRRATRQSRRDLAARPLRRRCPGQEPAVSFPLPWPCWSSGWAGYEHEPRGPPPQWQSHRHAESPRRRLPAGWHWPPPRRWP